MAEIVAFIALLIWLYLLAGARSLLALHRARRLGSPCGCRFGRGWSPSCRRATKRRPSRTASARCCGRTIRARGRSSWSMTTAATGPAAIAHGAAAAIAREDRLRVVTSRGLPAGWTGKLWALKQGIDAAAALPQPPDYLLLTDADIVHAPDSVAPDGRARRAERVGADLADGEAALRELGRARQRPGLHLLLPDALSVLAG